MDQNNMSTLQERILENSARCTEDNLLILKQHYAKEVNSCRQLERIKSVNDLLVVLRKRDSMSYECLKNIADVLNIQHNNIENRPSRVSLEVLPEIPSTTKERVYELISGQIGYKWIDLARALGIKEGHIDELDNRHKEIKRRTLEVLYYYEEVCDKRKWKSGLLQALGQARRNDLRKEAQEIFDIH